MKGVSKILAGWKTEGRARVARSSDGAGAVERTVDGARLLADVLHDVDFAARGPADGPDVVAKHPEGGPHSLPRGGFDPRFQAAITLVKETLCFHPRGILILVR